MIEANWKAFATLATVHTQIIYQLNLFIPYVPDGTKKLGEGEISLFA